MPNGSWKNQTSALLIAFAAVLLFAAYDCGVVGWSNRIEGRLSSHSKHSARNQEPPRRAERR